mmetsp:Transcript_45008/g.103924  ORF Transcript_45008/g.103924 Transcript_45008/m.103924 type:complete len:229 (-) Transcript_45008:12-698(-)
MSASLPWPVKPSRMMASSVSLLNPRPLSKHENTRASGWRLMRTSTLGSVARPRGLRSRTHSASRSISAQKRTRALGRAACKSAPSPGSCLEQSALRSMALRFSMADATCRPLLTCSISAVRSTRTSSLGAPIIWHSEALMCWETAAHSCSWWKRMVDWTELSMFSLMACSLVKSPASVLKSSSRDGGTRTLISTIAAGAAAACCSECTDSGRPKPGGGTHSVKVQVPP